MIKVKDKVMRIREMNITNSNLLMIIFVVFIVGNILFLLSPFYMSMGELKYTDINKPFTIGNFKELKIIKWDFDKKDKTMEVIFETATLEYIESEFDFQCITRPSKKIEVKKIIDENNYLVLQLLGVPESFREVSLHIIFGGQKQRVYTNKNQVNMNDNIEVKPIEGYYIEQHEINKDIKWESIYSLQNEINEHKQNIENYQNSIDEYRSSKKFKTSEQIIDIDKDITEHEKMIVEQENAIILKQNSITELKAQIDEIDNKINEINNYYLGDKNG